MCECYAWGFPYQLRITNALTPKAIVHLLHLTWWLHKMLCIKRCQPITNNWRSSINAIRNFLRRFEEFLPLSWDTLFLHKFKNSCANYSENFSFIFAPLWSIILRFLENLKEFCANKAFWWLFLVSGDFLARWCGRGMRRFYSKKM